MVLRNSDCGLQKPTTTVMVRQTGSRGVDDGEPPRTFSPVRPMSKERYRDMGVCLHVTTVESGGDW